MRPSIVTVVVVGLACASAARAQQCVEGKVIAPATAGHCCWPGQRWDESAARCSGAPQCPAGWAADENSCVKMPVVATPPPPAPVEAVPPAPTPSPATTPPPPATPPPSSATPPTQPYDYGRPQPTQPYVYGAAPGQPHVVMRPLKWAITTGVPLLVVGYVAGIIGGTVGLGFDVANPNDPNGFTACYQSWYYSYIPLFGPAITAAKFVGGRPTGSSAYPPGCSVHGGHDADAGVQFYGAMATILQVSGLALIITGVVVKRPVTVTRIDLFHHPAELALLPGGAQSPLGATLRLTL